MDVKYEWQQVSAGFTVKHGPKCYGPVRLLGGRIIYRNYHRPLKAKKLRHGEPKSFMDLFCRSVKITERKVLDDLMRKVFS